MFNQPTDHLEFNESLQEAAVWEESAYEFKPHHLIGIFRWHASAHDRLSMLPPSPDASSPISRNGRLTQTFVQSRTTMEEFRANSIRHRSPLVLSFAEDYLCGKRYPLDLLIYYG